MKTTYVFLDFDGVLHHIFPLAQETDDRNQLFAFLSDFENAIRACTTPVNIVVSSTWRNTRDLDELRQFFSEDIAHLIVGKTPFFDSIRNQNGSRLKEVMAYLKDINQEGSPWVGVDDYAPLYDPRTDPSSHPNPAVVVCSNGFSLSEHHKLLEAINNPIQFAQKHPVVSLIDAKQKGKNTLSRRCNGTIASNATS